MRGRPVKTRRKKLTIKRPCCKRSWRLIRTKYSSCLFGLTSLIAFLSPATPPSPKVGENEHEKESHTPADADHVKPLSEIYPVIVSSRFSHMDLPPRPIRARIRVTPATGLWKVGRMHAGVRIGLGQNTVVAVAAGAIGHGQFSKSQGYAVKTGFK